ncbi:NAD(P) transhydrogenase subunit alpha [Actinoplanes sp. TBRC 11911]|uniref:NAD(P) transhydrogenase subunit alpha n=1 Tax=Actinoplanes sp. TBRC 11911 TaxID=2729386 RepID=UPI00145C8E23|nr:NAD(P) transhydrogenase subunit alpha [Actinoplanes sp. TBRC 11911]NMO55749.1 NAD(P) transhydrogenase subunit alpha [Actinoplanes sp. TBRC 11911]
MTTVGVLRETVPRERRVALTPDGVARLRKQDIEVLVEAGAGEQAWFDDVGYAGAGAEIRGRDEVVAGADVLVGIHPPGDEDALRPGQVIIGLRTDPERLAGKGVTAIGLERLPRTLSRAQAMDALTSQANVAGYKAALVAAEAYGGFFPMLMTAAGTTRPAQVLVLGAGVAGLQAIATARRLGAMVSGFDVRPAARADIESTGAAVLDLGTHAAEGEGANAAALTAEGEGTNATALTAEGAGGYARALTADETRRQNSALAAKIPAFDVVITTAQVPGGRPPLLVPAAALDGMRPGSVVLDIAASPAGGNVEGSLPDTRIVTEGGVTVIGAGNLASTVPGAASTAYGRNVLALLAHLMPDGVLTLDLDDEIQAAVVACHGGQIRGERA